MVVWRIWHGGVRFVPTRRSGFRGEGFWRRLRRRVEGRHSTPERVLQRNFRLACANLLKAGQLRKNPAVRLRRAGGPGFRISISVGAPSFAGFFCEGRVPRRPAAAKLRHPIPERNHGPSLIQPYQPGLFEKIETITAPAPLLGRLHQSALYRVAMHIPEFLHALLRRP